MVKEKNKNMDMYIYVYMYCIITYMVHVYIYGNKNKIIKKILIIIQETFNVAIQFVFRWPSTAGPLLRIEIKLISAISFKLCFALVHSLFHEV